MLERNMSCSAIFANWPAAARRFWYPIVSARSRWPIASWYWITAALWRAARTRNFSRDPEHTHGFTKCTSYKQLKAVRRPGHELGTILKLENPAVARPASYKKRHF